MQELDEAGLLVSAQRPNPRKLSREDVCSPQHLPYLKAALKASTYVLTDPWDPMPGLSGSIRALAVQGGERQRHAFLQTPQCLVCCF